MYLGALVRFVPADQKAESICCIVNYFKSTLFSLFSLFFHLPCLKMVSESANVNLSKINTNENKTE